MDVESTAFVFSFVVDEVTLRSPTVGKVGVTVDITAGVVVEGKVVSDCLKNPGGGRSGFWSKRKLF